MFIRAFINPFIGILTLLIVVSYVLDVWTAAPEEKEWTTILIIATMILLSVIIRFCQDWRASRSSEALRKMVKNTCSVKRAGARSRSSRSRNSCRATSSRSPPGT